MLGIVVVTSEHPSGVPPIGLMNHGFDAMTGDHRAFGRALNELGGNQFLRYHDQALSGLGLLLIFPAWTVDPTITAAVGHLNMDNGDIRSQSSQENKLFARERTSSASEIIRGFVFEPLHHFGSQQRFDGYERDTECAGKIAESEREAARVDRDQGPVLARAIYATGGTEAVERPTSYNELRHQSGAYE